ncbi:hypothetical protein RB653_007097 [Dictyostelium firmibasis]|uniref:Uncharacterized protein n=1 Tax=Dictyostelium firmibasis TaxID=79012 RepID=A0AAN7YUC3_9MYCE
MFKLNILRLTLLILIIASSFYLIIISIQNNKISNLSNSIKTKDIILSKPSIQKELEITQNPCENNNNNNFLVTDNQQQFYGFKDENSLLNYFLTYKNYYMVENYNNKIYINQTKYKMFRYKVSPLSKTKSTFTPTIEETEININNLIIKENLTYEYQLVNNKEYHKLILKKNRAEMSHQFYEDYWRDYYSSKYSLDHGIIPFQPPNLQLPLNITKPLLSTPILFIHIPKCAGHTAYVLFENYFKGRGVTQLWVHPNPDIYYEISKANNVILGHYQYGIHKVLPEEFKKTYNYMTMLRDPVERVISHYYYHLNNPYDPEYQMARTNKLTEWLVKSPRGNNEMTRFLSGLTKDEEFKPNDETFHMALYHLRSMKFVGITERFKETIALLKFYVGIENHRIREKQNAAKKKYPEVPLEIIEIIKKRNIYDILLYEEALKMFERQIDIVGRDNFNDQLNKIL